MRGLFPVMIKIGKLFLELVPASVSQGCFSGCLFTTSPGELLICHYLVAGHDKSDEHRA
jgi:hypothetical protein